MIGRLMLLVASVGSTLALFEIDVRVIAPCPIYASIYEPPQQGFFEYDARLGWRGRPGARGVFSGTDFHTSVELDERGLRTSVAVLDPEKDDWLVVGDSFTWGWGVADDEIASEAMMRLDPSLNVTNLSAPGYGPGQELLRSSDFWSTRRRASPWRP